MKDGELSQADRTNGEWVTIEAERVLYVDRGKDVILVDRLPSPVTLFIKLVRKRATG